MNAEKILLTHFSARYPKMPPQIGDQTASPTIPSKPLTELFQSSTPPTPALPDVSINSTISHPLPTTAPEPIEKGRKQAIIGLAFDHMNITLGEFWKLRTYLPAMDQAFGKDEKDEDGDFEEMIVEKRMHG